MPLPRARTQLLLAATHAAMLGADVSSGGYPTLVDASCMELEP